MIVLSETIDFDRVDELLDMFEAPIEYSRLSSIEYAEECAVAEGLKSGSEEFELYVIKYLLSDLSDIIYLNLSGNKDVQDAIDNNKDELLRYKSVGISVILDNCADFDLRTQELYKLNKLEEDYGAVVVIYTALKALQQSKSSIGNVHLPN